MNTIKLKIKNEYENIRANTIHEVIVSLIVLVYLTSIPSIVFSNYDMQQQILTIAIFSLLSMMNYIIAHIAKYMNFKSETRFKIYLAMSLFYLVLINFSAPGKYMTTTGTAVIVFLIVMFLSLSKTLLVIQGVVTLMFTITNGYLAIGHTVEIGSGYVYNITGMVFLAGFTLYKGIGMYRKFEELYLDQLLSVNEMNLELTALNEEYVAAKEELRYQYDEISRLNKDFTNLNDFLSALLKVTEDGFLTFNLLTKESKL